MATTLLAIIGGLIVAEIYCGRNWNSYYLDYGIPVCKKKLKREYSRIVGELFFRGNRVVVKERKLWIPRHLYPVEVDFKETGYEVCYFKVYNKALGRMLPSYHGILVKNAADGTAILKCKTSAIRWVIFVLLILLVLSPASHIDRAGGIFIIILYSLTYTIHIYDLNHSAKTCALYMDRMKIRA